LNNCREISQIILIPREGNNVWILTLYLQDSIKMFEYDNKDEAREEYEKSDGCKILSEIIHYTDFEKKR
jgi:hypothetical protein